LSVEAVQEIVAEVEVILLEAKLAGVEGTVVSVEELPPQIEATYSGWSIKGFLFP
jgi:hypothetical protein